MLRLFVSAGFGLLLGAGLGACTSNHDALAVHPSRGGSGGALRDASSGGQGGSDGGVLDAPPDATPDVTEPSGPDELTLLHGVVDAKRIVFCFARVEGGAGTPVGSPLPVAGLAFGHATVVASLPGLDFTTDAIQPIVIAGDLSLVSGMTCDAALAFAAQLTAPDAAADAAPDAVPDAAPDASAIDGAAPDAAVDAAPDADAGPPVPPALRVEALPVLPAGTLTGGRSYLLVAAGCMGAPGFHNALDQALCGAGYSPDQPTLTPVLVRMSRITVADRLGLEVVNASRATGTLDLRSGTPPRTTQDPLPIATGVGFGAILPRPPRLDQSLIAYGTPLAPVRLEVLSGGSSPVLSPTWSDAMSLGGVSKLDNGRTYTLVVIGPRVDIATAGWWHPPAVTLVPSAP